MAAAVAQFYEETTAPAEVHVPVAPEEAEALEALLAARAGRKVRIVVPRRGEKRGLLDLASRNAALAYEARFNAETLGNYSALETLRAVLALPALATAHRLLRHLDHSGQRDRGVDGGLRRRPHEEGRVQEIQSYE